VTKKADPNAKEIFDTLADEWDKFDRTAMELLTICAGTSAANRFSALLQRAPPGLNSRANVCFVCRHRGACTEQLQPSVRPACPDAQAPLESTQVGTIGRGVQEEAR
jgi:hypothetical protein